MSVPNHSSIVQQVYKAGHYDLTTKIGCGRFIEDVAFELHKHDQNWGQLKKPNSLGGANHWMHHGVDVVCYKSGNHATAVDLVKAGESSSAELGWNPDQEGRYAASDWYEQTTPSDFVLPTHQCKLGASFFWYFGAWRKHRHGEAGWQDKIDKNADWLKNTLCADYVRDFSTVGGHVDNGTGQDPWSVIGSFYHWSDWADVIGSGIDYLTDKHGLLHGITLVGEGAQFKNDDEILQMTAQMATIVKAHRSKVWFVEMWNEHEVTGGNKDIVRKMGERFFASLPDFPFALDTPNAAMGGLAEGDLQPLWDDTQSLYGGTHATIITPQWNRAEPNPLDMGPAATHLLAISHEPRGPEASAGGNVHDPLPLMHDYIQASMAKSVHMAGPVNYSGYTAHCAPGVWGGYCNPAFPNENIYANWYDLPQAAELAHALSSIRAGHMPTGTSPPKGPPPRADQLLSGQALNVGQALKAEGFTCQFQADANLVTYDAAGAAVWASQTSHASPGQVNMQIDGNLCIYTTDGVPLWASHTQNHQGAMCQLNPDGTLVIYADPAGEQAGTALWSSSAGLVG
jgi:hypothetical protein